MIRKLGMLLAAVICIGLLGGCGSTSSSEAASNSTPSVTQQALEATGAQMLSYNPLTGEALPEGASAGKRPVAVMINNANIALPQRGIAAADALLEMVTEGGVTRLLALYSDPATMPTVGPVRSARDQHLQFAIPLNAIFVHIGSSVYAENLLNTYAYPDIDGLYLGTTAFTFDAERAKTRAQEHCWYTDSALITGAVAAKGMPTTGESHPLLPFADSKNKATAITEGAAPDVQFSFSPSNTVRFTYNAEQGLYYKFAYGAPHIDELDGTQLSFKNVLMLTAKIGLKQDEYCSDFMLTSGTGYYFSNGSYQQVRWKKGNPEDPLVLTDTAGKPIYVNTGKTYIGIVGTDLESTLVMDAAAAAAQAASQTE